MKVSWIFLWIQCFQFTCSYFIGKSSPWKNQISRLFENHENKQNRMIKWSNYIQTSSIDTLLIASILSVTIIYPSLSFGDSTTDELLRLKRGLKEITYLLDNWDEKTTYCNFGEFQRDLLKPENKKKLLIAAAETSLFDYDKSATMNVMCKKDPLVVRAFLGLSKENLNLVKADSLMKKQSTISRISEDDMESYFDAVDTFSRSIAEIDSLTYGARVDYASTETSPKNNILSQTSSQDYLQQSKNSVIVAKEALEIIVKDLHI